MHARPIKDHPAFPVQPHPGDSVNKPVRGNSGMSMLDFFAGCAVMGLASAELQDSILAKEAYNIAEELMQERHNRYSLNK